ncbi:FAD-dependent monooxygenase [Nocardia sp. NPDC051030]|uniref:NAD(P)/FAD-dependent oxidoreductase n=1 Tax=Nocardia sp. NPDC051030 TaxID=3155162 RepID=UPI0034255F26
MTKAVILGGGLAGLLAAAAVAPYATEVTLVESDEMNAQPLPRKGIPQGRHSHTLMCGGARAIEHLLPGTTNRLTELGARRLDLPADVLTCSAEGWYRRHPGSAYVLACSRPVIDHAVYRSLVAAHDIRIRTGTKAAGLIGDGARVTGVRTDSGTLSADLVIDATGRGSRAPQWLAELGVPPVHEAVVDPGLVYVTRRYDAPSVRLPAVMIQPRPGTGEPGMGAAIFPIEGGQWIVTMIGTRGGVPPTDPDGYTEFARRLRHSVVSDLLDRARPAGPILSYRGTLNRRRHFERVRLPEGFLAIGDAVTALNPNYGAGMSVAARQAVVLRNHLARRGITDGLGRLAQAGAAKEANSAWNAALGTDLWFPEVRSTVGDGKAGQFRFANRFARTAAVSPVLARALFDVHTFSAPEYRLLRPEVLLAVLRGPRRAPLSAAEALAQFPELSGLLESKETIHAND